MTLKRMVILFIAILDVAVFPFACPRTYKESVSVEYFERISYTDEIGNIRYVLYDGIRFGVYLEDGYVKLREDVKLEQTILDYSDISETSEPVSKTYRIAKWYKIGQDHRVDETTDITLPYKTSSSDFLTYYCGKRNVVVLVPVIEEVE